MPIINVADFHTNPIIQQQLTFDTISLSYIVLLLFKHDQFY